MNDTVKALPATIIGGLAGGGASVIANNACKMLMPDKSKKLRYILSIVGGLAISSMVSDKVEKYSSEKIRGIVDAVSTFAGSMKELKEEMDEEDFEEEDDD